MSDTLNEAFRSAGIAAVNALRVAVRDKTVLLLTAMFLVMVLVSAYLGWSATNTVTQIYAKAVPALQALGRPIPPNPVGDTPVLSLFRNMVTYVALLGALAALVLGYQTVAADRKSGVVPLMFTRPVARYSMALGKIIAITVLVASILCVAALVNSATILLLPGVVITSAVWMGLLKFYCVSFLYMLAFALMAASCAAWFKTESIALLTPVTTWLALTFVVPQITANIGPLAALNPISANIIPPTAWFFTYTSTILGPISIAESYRHLASGILEITSSAGQSTTTVGSLAALLIIIKIMSALFIAAYVRMDACRSEYLD
jgi:ABC-type transport system involved in multi-copper enzyme maturation permease subunit